MDFTHAVDGETIFMAHKYPEVPTFSHTFGVEDFIKIHQGPVVQTLDSAIHRINYYPADKH